MSKFRTGRKVGRTIYLQWGAEPSDADELIGVMDTPYLARRVVDAVNIVASMDEGRALYPESEAT